MSKKSRAENNGFFIKGGLDIPFLAIVIALITIGLTMLLSASYAYCYYYFDNSLHYFLRQAAFAVGGIVIMFFISHVNYKYLKMLTMLVMAISMVLLVVVLFVTPRQGFEDFHRWIYLGPVSFQPSEIAKFALILYLAKDIDRHYIGINSNRLSENPRLVEFRKTSGLKIRDKTACFAKYFFVIFLFAGLVYKENHVSGAVLLVMLGVFMLYLAGYNNKIFIVIGVLGIVAIIAVINNPEILPSHAQSRITSWLDKDFDPRGVRWQTNQAIYAIGSGGFFGVGLGQSKLKQLYVSEPQNDFIFSIVCEELGLVGALIIVALFILLVWRGFVIGIHANDKFGSLLAMGLVFQVGLQAALNIGVVTDVLPNTGISLPFFSYGGTSLLMLIFEMGIVLSISRTAKLKKA